MVIEMDDSVVAELGNLVKGVYALGYCRALGENVNLEDTKRRELLFFDDQVSIFLAARRFERYRVGYQKFSVNWNAEGRRGCPFPSAPALIFGGKQNVPVVDTLDSDSKISSVCEASGGEACNKEQEMIGLELEMKSDELDCDDLGGESVIMLSDKEEEDEIDSTAEGITQKESISSDSGHLLMPMLQKGSSSDEGGQINVKAAKKGSDCCDKDESTGRATKEKLKNFSKAASDMGIPKDYQLTKRKGNTDEGSLTPLMAKKE